MSKHAIEEMIDRIERIAVMNVNSFFHSATIKIPVLDPERK